MTRPLLLDLFCGAGGAAVGYYRAGFDVIGVDINPQPRYPFEFIQADALDYVARNSEWFDAIHASPPCQFYSEMSACRPGLAAEYPDLIGPTRELLQTTGLPYVIENVPRAKKWLDNPMMLCGRMFGLDLYRHRLFEMSEFTMQPGHPAHSIVASRAGHWVPGTIISVAGGGPGTAEKRRAMGIDWMTRDELAEAIPPAYTEYIGAQLIEACRAAA